MGSMALEKKVRGSNIGGCTGRAKEVEREVLTSCSGTRTYMAKAGVEVETETWKMDIPCVGIVR